MTGTIIGYVRCATDRQDLGAKLQALLELGVAEDCSYTDHGLTGTTRAIADLLQERGVKPALGRTLYDPDDPIGKMFFNILATFAEFEAYLIRMRTREDMAIARTKGKLRGEQPKLSERHQRELCRMHATGEYSISDLAEIVTVSRPTVCRALNRRLSP